MLNSFWKYASPIKNSIAQNKQTNIVNNNYSYENEILKGTLFIKTNNTHIHKISNDCLIEINNFSNDYSLRIKYNGNELIIDNNTQLFQFENSFGNKCITWKKNLNYYILELHQEKGLKNKENIFLVKLPSISPISTINSGKSSETKTYTQSKTVNNIDIFSCNSINSKNNESLFASSNISDKMNDNKYISKEIFKKRFEEYKEIYIIKGTAFRYDKLLEEVIPFKDKKNESIQSLLKINYIGNSTYILVLEQNEFIISFIKIIDINDISINENSGSISFNYTDEKGEYNPYIFSFEEKSMNELNYFRNIILRCIYEKNKSKYELDFNQNLFNFNSMDINSEFDQEFDLDQSPFFSTKKKYAKEMKFIIGNNNDSGLKKNLIKDFQSNSFSNDDNSKINKKNIFINDLGTFEISFDNSSLRLFNEKGEIIKAFTTENQCPIKYIDLSHDNQFILITCDKELIILNTNTLEKSEPIILRISQSELIQYKIYKETFSYAKFFTNANSDEKMIASSLGKYIIIWNFEKVLKGEKNCYRIIE